MICQRYCAQILFRSNFLALMSLMTLTVYCGFANAQDADDKTDKDAKSKKLDTVKVEAKPISVYRSFDGVFESTRVQEVKTNFDVWTDLKIDSVVEEGTAVSAGQELLSFETEKIDKSLSEAEFALRNAEFDLESAKLDLREANETFGLDQEATERKWQNAREDHEYYLKIQLPQRLKDIDYDEKTASYMLEYSQDELDQLEKMYTEDELTEESEEIVLKRARRSVESAQRSKDRSLMRVQRQRDMDVPREKIQKEESLRRSEISYQRSQITLPIKKRKAEIALAQAEFALKNKQKNFEELERDRKNLVLKAPADGIVYFGRAIRGKWVGAQGSSARRLERFKKVPANAVVMTIVDVNQMMIRASLTEEQLAGVTPMMRGNAMLKSTSNRVVPVRIKSVSRIPLDDGKFDCQILAEQMPADAAIMPGMGCKLSFLVYENKQALVAPKASVFSDDGGVTHYVYVNVDGEPKRKVVSKGHTSGENVEILDGLAIGDEIAKSKPQ